MLDKATYSVTMPEERDGRGERHLKIMAAVRGRSVSFPTGTCVERIQPKGGRVIGFPTDKADIGGDVLRCKNCSFFRKRSFQLFRKAMSNGGWCGSFSERIGRTGNLSRH